jgi:hypothetical protein
MSGTTMRAHAVAEPTQVGLDALIRNCLNDQIVLDENNSRQERAIWLEGRRLGSRGRPPPRKSTGVRDAIPNG